MPVFAAVRFCTFEKMERKAPTNRQDIEAIRDQTSCAALLEEDSWHLDRKGSTRRALKFRKAAAIIIVTHAGRGCFDPLPSIEGRLIGIAEVEMHVVFCTG